MFISGVKDLFEDLKRKKSDLEENTRTVRMNGQTKVLWRDVKVGHIIRVNQDEFVPADIIFIVTSDPQGVAYVETKSLDGETNLKHKKLNPDITKRLNEANVRGYLWVFKLIIWLI